MAAGIGADPGMDIPFPVSSVLWLYYGVVAVFLKVLSQTISRLLPGPRVVHRMRG
jgi:hypothetical protein